MTQGGQSAPGPGAKPKKLLIIGTSIVGVLVLVGAALVFWYMNQPVPEEVSLESAVADVATTEPSTGGTTSIAPPDSEVSGTWFVDTTVGVFSFEDATSSFVGFRINEVLANVGATTAVGRTPVLTGSLTLVGTTVTETSFTADLTQIVTNASRRDRVVQRALNTGTFPTATFTLTEPIQLGDVPQEGVPISVTAVGTMEINGVTQTIEFPLETQLAGDLIVVVGGANIAFADWGVEMPTAPGVISVEDQGILEIQLFLSRDPSR